MSTENTEEVTYEVRITKKSRRVVTKRGEHTVIGEEPWTKQSISEQSLYGTMEDFLRRSPTKSVYGYAPDYKTFEDVSTEVLRQELPSIDIAAVIKAVNGL